MKYTRRYTDFSSPFRRTSIVAARPQIVSGPGSDALDRPAKTRAISKRPREALAFPWDDSMHVYVQAMAGKLILRYLVATPQLNKTEETHAKVLALHSLLDEIARRMKTLPASERPRFFRSSIVIVAEILAVLLLGESRARPTLRRYDFSSGRRKHRRRTILDGRKLRRTESAGTKLSL